MCRRPTNPSSDAEAISFIPGSDGREHSSSPADRADVDANARWGQILREEREHGYGISSSETAPLVVFVMLSRHIDRYHVILRQSIRSRLSVVLPKNFPTNLSALHIEGLFRFSCCIAIPVLQMPMGLWRTCLAQLFAHNMKTQDMAECLVTLMLLRRIHMAA